jgi:hypothetical protein
MFRTDDRIGLGSLYAPTALDVHGGRNGSPHTRCVAVLAQATQHLWPVRRNDAFIEDSPLLAMPPTLAPCRLDAGRETLPSRFEPSFRTGYVVRVLRTACYLAALPRRVLAVESQVASDLSLRDNHLCDFMSHAVVVVSVGVRRRDRTAPGADDLCQAVDRQL